VEGLNDKRKDKTESKGMIRAGKMAITMSALPILRLILAKVRRERKRNIDSTRVREETCT
jgi:hypothetical protein